MYGLVLVLLAAIAFRLGCYLGDVFEHIDHGAVAAASVAQVHFAELKDGTKVAVKVQFPDVERFFEMDVATVSLALQLIGMGGQVKEIFQTMQEQFKEEFDFTAEASILREVADQLMRQGIFRSERLPRGPSSGGRSRFRCRARGFIAVERAQDRQVAPKLPRQRQLVLQEGARARDRALKCF